MSDIAIEQKHLITLVAATGICNLMELEKLIPQNSRIAGQTRRIAESLTILAGIVGGKLDDEWINVGVNASNAGMDVIKKAIIPPKLVDRDERGRFKSKQLAIAPYALTVGK